MIDYDKVSTGDYYGCFTGNGWLSELHPESWDHPARVAFGLSARLYTEAVENGWFAPGMTVLDPFAGVAGFAFHAITRGINFVGVEIEIDYLQRAQKNLDLWCDRYQGKLPRWGEPRIYLGDSRELSKIIPEPVDGIISSPTYCELLLHNPHPAAQNLFSEKHLYYDVTENYGKAGGQTGNMKPGEYWATQKEIAIEIKKILKPGSYLIWVVKRYVRYKKMVNFPMQWAELYDEAGFEIIGWRKAWQIEENGVQLEMFGDNKRLVKDYRSFFRARHARNYPDMAINWEDCVIARLPELPPDKKDNGHASREATLLMELGYGD